MKKSDKILEVCSASYLSAVNAQKGGAKRIELCENLLEGGCTPSYGMIKTVRKALDIQVFVLIRPRGGDFLYSDEEYKIMKENILMAKSLGVDGIVSGILQKDGSIDVERTKELVDISRPLEFTFHRAFDMVNDAEKAINDIINTGADRILTSGLENTALEGVKMIAYLQKKYSKDIKIMPGSGINTDNIEEIATKTNCNEFHASARELFESEMQFRVEKVKLHAPNIDNYNRKDSSVSVVNEIINKLI